MKKLFRVALAAILSLALSGAPAMAQIPSNIATVNLSMTISESLTVTATPGAVDFSYNGTGAATASGPISVTTTWFFGQNRVLSSAAYFSSTTALSGPTNISVNNVMGAVDGGAAHACNGTMSTLLPAAPAATNCDPFIVGKSVTGGGTETHTLLLSLTGITPGVGTYSGVLNISAYAS